MSGRSCISITCGSNLYFFYYAAPIITDSPNDLLRLNGMFGIIAFLIWRLKRWKNMGWHFQLISACDRREVIKIQARTHKYNTESAQDQTQKKTKRGNSHQNIKQET